MGDFSKRQKRNKTYKRKLAGLGEEGGFLFLEEEEKRK